MEEIKHHDSNDFSYNAEIIHPKPDKIRNPYLKSKTTIVEPGMKLKFERDLGDNILEDIEFESSESRSSKSSVSCDDSSDSSSDGSGVINLGNNESVEEDLHSS